MVYSFSRRLLPANAGRHHLSYKRRLQADALRVVLNCLSERASIARTRWLRRCALVGSAQRAERQVTPILLMAVRPNDAQPCNTRNTRSW